MGTLVIDIETLPLDARVGMDLTCAPGWGPPATRLEMRSPPGNWKDPEKIAAFLVEESHRYAAAIAAELDDNREAALKEWRDSVFAFDGVRIALIGICDGYSAQVIDCEQAGERAGLEDLQSILAKHGDDPIWTFGSYDPRIIRSRLLAHGIHFEAWSTRRKPWERRVADLQARCAEILHGSQREIRGVSVDRVCRFLGIERAEQIRGGEILDAYVRGDWRRAVEHCESDVWDEWKILEALEEVER